MTAAEAIQVVRSAGWRALVERTADTAPPLSDQQAQKLAAMRGGRHA